MKNTNGDDSKKLEEHLLDFYKYIKEKGKSHESAMCFINPVKQIVKFAKHRLVLYPDQVTGGLYEEFQLALYSERGFEYDTVRVYFYRIWSFIRFLSDNGVEIHKEFQILPKPKIDDGKLTRYYTFEDLQKRYIATQRKWISFSYSNGVQKNLTAFFKYLRTQEIKIVYKIHEGTILKYRDFLWNDFKEGRDHALVVEGQVSRLRTVNKFLRFLYRERIIEKMPTFNIDWKAYYKKIRKDGRNIKNPTRYRDWVPEPLKEIMQKFIDYEKAIGKSDQTTDHYKESLKVFFDFLDNKGITSIDQVTKRTMLDYYTFLLTYKGLRGEGIASSTRACLLMSVKVFFRFLARFDFIPKDPTHDIESIKEEQGLPKDYMNEKEMLRVLDKPSTNSPLGLRNKTVMEVLFSTGIRANELREVNLSDIDYHEGMLRVNCPKGGSSYQRVIPIGDIALSYVKLYLKEARPKLENGHHTNALFLSYKGNRIYRYTSLSIVKQYAFQAGIRKNITAHSFRVSCATLMLKHKAGLRYVQEQLGHRRITSTQKYTRLVPLDLKKEHSRCHPRENKAE